MDVLVVLSTEASEEQKKSLADGVSDISLRRLCVPKHQ